MVTPSAPATPHRSSPAEFHRTISDQLNGRLSESPRFFWAVVVVATGYGYALWYYPPQFALKPYQHLALILISLVAFGVAALAEWYIAALGYGFRFLQGIQQAIENDLGWERYCPPRGKSPGNPLFHPLWLLPSIYWPHALAFFGLMILVAIGSSVALHANWGWFCIALAGLAFYLPNVLYHRKFRLKR